MKNKDVYRHTDTHTHTLYVITKLVILNQNRHKLNRRKPMYGN